MKEGTLCLSQLVLCSVTILGQLYVWYLASQLGQLSLASLCGHKIEHRLNLAGVKTGVSPLLGDR